MYIQIEPKYTAAFKFQLKLKINPNFLKVEFIEPLKDISF